MSSSSYGPGRSGPSGSASTGGDVVVTGIGMRTAIGNDAAQTCATHRTAIGRFVEWPHMGIGPDDAGVVGAPIQPDLGDAPWQEKWFDLVRQPVHEALWQAELYDGVPWKRRFGEAAKIGVWIATPAVDREDVDPEFKKEFEAALPTFCIDPATADVMELVPMDHAAGLIAVGRAALALMEGRVKVAVVIGVEANLSSPWLEELDDQGVLKTSTRNIGLIPGDAGGVLVLERRGDAKKRGATPLLSLGTVALEREETPIGPEHPIVGTALGKVVKRCLAPRGGGVDVKRIIVDLNGQRWRALEWAMVETRCLGKVPHGWKLWHPADCYGDVGAAGGVLSLGIAARAYERDYGGSGSMLVVSVSVTGERVALIVTPGEPKA